MNRTWRSQKINNNRVLLNPNSTSELWWEACQRVDNLKFFSSESNKHQLDPINYGLSIPDKSYLINYSKSLSVRSLLGKGDSIRSQKNDYVATIYHELFHVFQTNSTKKVLDYFYLVDDIQRKRSELLEYLGHCNFFTLAESTDSKFGRSIFHCVENYNELGSRESLSDMLLATMSEVLEERYTEIDEDIENFVAQHGEHHRDEFQKQAKYAKESFKEIIDSQIKDSISLIQQQSNDIKKYSDLSRSRIKELIEFFKFSHDEKLHLFHLIEGSANIFGWCCAGYNINDRFSLREKEFTEKNPIQQDTYDKAYRLFKEHEGNTPLIFIIITLLSLSSSNSIDVFIWSLKKVKIWEGLFNKLLLGKEINDVTFRSITISLIEHIENSIKGNFFTRDMNSIHDREDENSIFLKSINRIRKVAPQIDNFEFLTSFILDKNLALVLVESFESHAFEFKDSLRKNEVMRDFEQFLRKEDEDFKLKCCTDHKFTHRYDFEWKECNSVDGFYNILRYDFKINMPDKLLDE